MTGVARVSERRANFLPMSSTDRVRNFGVEDATDGDGGSGGAARYRECLGAMMGTCYLLCVFYWWLEDKTDTFKGRNPGLL